MTSNSVPYRQKEWYVDEVQPWDFNLFRTWCQSNYYPYIWGIEIGFIKYHKGEIIIPRLQSNPL